MVFRIAFQKTGQGKNVKNHIQTEEVDYENHDLQAIGRRMRRNIQR